MTKFEFQTKDWVLTRDCVTNNVWGLDIFSHKKGNECVTIAGLVWDEGSCIPYNETTKHLCGTSDPYIDPTDFEVGDTVSFRYTENTTGCGEIVRITGDTIQVSVSGGVYSVDRKRLTLVRRGEKKIEAPAEAPVFEFGDVVVVSFPGEKPKKGIFARFSNTEGKFRCNVLLRLTGDGTLYNTEIPTSYVRLTRKGNFND